MNRWCSDMVLCLPSIAVWLIEGENDGLLTPASAAWTNFRGVIRSASNRGISHCDEMDMRRRRLTKKQCKDKISDTTDFYKTLVMGLKERGL